MKPVLSTIAAILVALFTINSTYAISWKTYTNSRKATCLVEHDGRIWAGTSGGVLRFNPDGSGLIRFTNSEGLGDNDIVSGIAAGGYLWFGSTTGKLSRFDPLQGDFRIFMLRDRDGNAVSINDMAHYGDFIWIATDIGISKFDMYRNGGEVKETYRRLGDFTVETPILSISIYGDLLTAASREGVAFADADDQFLQDFNHWTAATASNSTGYPQDDVENVLAWQNDPLVGTASGLFRVLQDGSSFTWELAGLDGQQISELHLVGNTVHITTTDSLFVYDGSSIDALDISGLGDVTLRVSLDATYLVVGTEDDGIFVRGSVGDWDNVVIPGPASNAVVAVGGESGGKTWVIVKEPEVSSFDGENWEHMELPRSGSGQRDLVVDHNNDVWIGTWGNGALRITEDSLIEYDTTNSSLYGNDDKDGQEFIGLNYVVVTDIDIDKAGRLWFTCYRGHPMRPVSFYDPATGIWDFYTSHDGLTDHFIQAIHVVGDVLWTGYENAGLFRTTFGDDPFDHADVTSRQYSTQDTINYNLPSDNIRVISSVVRAGELGASEVVVWIGTNAGLTYYDEGIDRFRRIELPSGASPQINALESDPFSNLWVGTSSGLVLIPADGSSMELYTTANSGIAGDEITSLHFGADEYLWIGTSTGLSRLDIDAGVFTSDIEEVFAYPNPFIIPDHLREVPEGVRFNFKGTTEVRIFTLSGELVREGISNTGGWDGRNDSGALVAGGLYLFYIVTPEGVSHTGKIAVIRK
jgi:ligand-binding sensor domain-containing protein